MILLILSLCNFVTDFGEESTSIFIDVVQYIIHNRRQNVLSADQIIERANQMGGGGEGSQPLADGTYLVGDIAMTKEQYEEHMAEWKIQEAELIARGEITPDK